MNRRIQILVVASAFRKVHVIVSVSVGHQYEVVLVALRTGAVASVVHREACSENRIELIASLQTEHIACPVVVTSAHGAEIACIERHSDVHSDAPP